MKSSKALVADGSTKKNKAKFMIRGFSLGEAQTQLEIFVLKREKWNKTYRTVPGDYNRF